ncbi:MAG: Transcription factor homologous to NACalpha-BTF3 [Methanophagales archaeon]|nr:Transcription factor homologous to NACalpha-BTF3 [Methanophagales archaeon]
MPLTPSIKNEDKKVKMRMRGGFRAGLSPKMLSQLMRQAGIRVEELEGVEQVVIKTADAEIVFEDASVTVMDAQGSKIFQIFGTPQIRERSEEKAKAAEEASSEAVEEEAEEEIPEEDIALVAATAGCTEEEARKMLEETGGDLAEAISRLSAGKSGEN